MRLRAQGGTPLPSGVVRAELARRQGDEAITDAGALRADLCALLVDARGCARGPDDFVHSGAAAHALGAVRLQQPAPGEGDGPGGRDGCDGRDGRGRDGRGGPGSPCGRDVNPAHAADGKPGVNGPLVVGILSVDLAAVDPAVASVLVVARGTDGPAGRLPALRLRVTAGGTEVARYDSAGADGETACVLGEFRRHGDGWRFHVVGQGYRTGRAGLAAAHGLPRDALPGLPAPAAEPGPGTGLPARGGRAVPVTLSPVAPTVALAAQGGTSGALTVTLDRRSTFARGAAREPAGPAGVRLGALYELTDGRKGVVQALGRALGAFAHPPHITLDLHGGRDGGGPAAPGDPVERTYEAIRLNLDHSVRFRRVLFFVTVHQGVASLAGLRGAAVLRPEHGAPITVPLEECDTDAQVCALAAMAYEEDRFVVRREARYLRPRRGVSPQRTVDYAYGWGLNWAPRRA